MAYEGAGLDRRACGVTPMGKSEQSLIWDEVESEGDSFEFPYDPSLIDITTQPVSVFNIVERLKSGEIDMAPDFQRHPDLWKGPIQSRLIESLILGIPLQALYFDVEVQRHPDKVLGTVNRSVWHVVDGLQRLSAIRKFVLGDVEDDGRRKYLVLKNLEYLKRLNGLKYADLPEPIRRTILESTIQAYLIRPGTPEKIKFNIFKRVNTGGLPLRQQEIRHALLHGPGTSFIAELSALPVFRLATQKKVPSRRMQDREFVNRFVAFYLLDIGESYTTMDVFLNDAIRMLNHLDGERLAEIKTRFESALQFIADNLGKHAFHRYEPAKDAWNRKLNKAIFESLTVGVAKLSEEQRESIAARGDFLERYRGLFCGDEGEGFNSFIMTATGNRQKAIGRNACIAEFLNGLLEC